MKLETVMRMYLSKETEQKDIDSFIKGGKWNKVSEDETTVVLEHKFMTQDEKWEEIRKEVNAE